MRAGVARVLPRLAPPLHRCPAPCAIGFTDFVQSTRDATQTSFGLFKTVAIPLVVAAALSAGITAWRAGGALREASGAAQLGDRELGLLALCLAIDLFGGSSLVLGEASDIVWAPLSAYLVGTLFGSSQLAALNAAKELLLPFGDVVPVATIGWLLKYAFPASGLARRLGLGADDDDDMWRP